MQGMPPRTHAGGCEQSCGVETGASADITFYGTSFIADETGAIVADAGEEDGTVITARWTSTLSVRAGSAGACSAIAARSLWRSVDLRR